MLCFAATCVRRSITTRSTGPAPYPLTSLPVLLGIVGGVGLLIGPLGLIGLKVGPIARPTPTRSAAWITAFSSC